MGLSSNILWHQTKETGFWKILESKQLLFSYSLETITVDGVTLELAFPMISLADLPFAELDFFLNCEKYDVASAKFENYGGYLFGFRREWGTLNKFSPVWYCENHHEGLRRIVERWKTHRDDAFLYHLLGNIKNIEGELTRFNLDLYRFYNEREYRLLLEASDYRPLTKNEYEQYKAAHGKSSICEPRQGVTFTPADIVYIIVPDAGARREFLRSQTGEWGRIPVFTRDEVNQNFIGIRHHHIKAAVDEKKSDEIGQTISDTSNSDEASIKAVDAQTYVESRNPTYNMLGLDQTASVPQNIKTILDAFAKYQEAVRAVNEPFDKLNKMIEKFTKGTSILTPPTKSPETSASADDIPSEE